MTDSDSATVTAKRPTTQAPSPQAPADTRERILRVAAEAWHSRSFDGIGTAEICRRAEVHKGSFFHFFPTKEDLLLAVLGRYAEQVGLRLRQGPFAGDVPPLARFARFMAGQGESAARDLAANGCMKGCPIGNIVLELSTRSPAVQQAAARVFDVMQTVFREALDCAVATGELPPATDTKALAGAVLAFVQGIAVLGKAYGDLGRLAPVAGHLMTLLRTGGQPA